MICVLVRLYPVPLNEVVVTYVPLSSPCAAEVVIVAVLPESRARNVEVSVVKLTAAAVGAVSGIGSPSV